MTTLQERPPAVEVPEEPHRSWTSTPTRQLCASMHLYPGLRNSVLELFLGERHRAWGPNYGVDSTAVIRHAWWARRWQRIRDTALGLVLLAMVVTLVSRWWAHGRLVAVGATIAWIVAAVALRRLMRRRRWTARRVAIWYRQRKESWRQFIWWCAAVVVAALGFTGYGFWQAVGRREAMVIGVAAGVVLLIGILDETVVMARARRAMFGRPGGSGERPPREQAPALPARPARRLADLHDSPEPPQTSEHALARVVTYDFGSRRDTFLENTFVGSGSVIDQFQFDIDVARGRTTASGSRKKPKPVDLVSVHHGLERVALTDDLPGSWVGYRTYVDGNGLPELPDCWLPLERMLPSLLHPTADRRTYLCYQVPVVNWDERIILTLFLRADLTGDNLMLHIDTLMLPLMTIGGSANIHQLPRDWWTHGTSAVCRGSTRVWRAAVRGLFWLPGDLSRLTQRVFATWFTNYRIRHHRPVGRGAAYSVREKLAEGVIMVHPNAVQDINRTIAFLMQALRNGLSDYLKSRNIDTSSLEDDIRTVIHRQQNKIGQLHSKNVVFGKKGKAGDQTPDKEDKDDPEK
ncbi:hypothetical protein [Actinoplanes flavus]|uniref:Uncharacterized protein n=1 Tax=Actinoplanes flavus TaxID=2820290 RepID=A0ABS3UQV8_9ACTN|nr:hypothetical protein [Actinoplanes flavus]MBO3741163.1 hypothetical protein [Actinoplanes flavus]